MIIYQNECVGCGFHCLRNACRYYAVPHYYCDSCGREIDADEVTTIHGEHLCYDCAHEDEEPEDVQPAV